MGAHINFGADVVFGLRALLRRWGCVIRAVRLVAEMTRDRRFAIRDLGLISLIEFDGLGEGKEMFLTVVAD